MEEFNYPTKSIPYGRDLKNWTKEEIINELHKLLYEFKNPIYNSPKQKTYNLIEEIISTHQISTDKFGNDFENKFSQYQKWKFEVNESIKQDDSSRPFSTEIEEDGYYAIENMVFFFINNFVNE